MTVSHSWQVYFTDASSQVELSSYVLGFSLHQSVQIGRMGSYNGYLHLDNSTNIFTPDAGGTYQAFDWFSKIVEIRCAVTDSTVTTSNAQVADMVITDIDFQDDGQKATVMLTLADFLCYAARDQVTELDTTAVVDELDDIAATILNGNSDISRVPFPKFGATNISAVSVRKMNEVPAGSSNAAGFFGVIDEFDSGTAKDHINAQCLPSGPALMYPTVANYSGSSEKFTLYVAYVNRLMTKSAAYYKSYDFTDTPTADKFPIQKISTQYNLIDTINQASIQAVYPVSGEGPSVSNDTTSQDDIGVRSVSYSKVIAWQFGGATMADKAVIGDFWTNRFSDVTYTPQQLSIVLEAVDQQMDSSSRSTYAEFLGVETGLWSIADVTFTPTGGSSSKTYNCVIAGRQIFATPDHTTISLDLLPAADNQSFTLNSANLGILDENRLG